MECMMITYSMIETLILWLIVPEQMQGAALLEQLIKSMMPFITRKYWFYSSYICLMLFAGYIQQLLDCLKKREVMKLLILLLVLFSVFPALFYFELIPDNGKGIGQMIMIYMIGRYIRLYQDRQLSLKAWFIFGGLWVINGISHEFPIQIGGIYHHLCKDNSITNIIMAVILFYMVKEWKFHSKVINKVAGCMFAVFALNNSLVKCMMEVYKGDFSFRFPVLVPLWSYCVLASMFTESIYAGGGPGAGRIYNVIFLTYLILIMLNLVYLYGWYWKNMVLGRK